MKRRALGRMAIAIVVIIIILVAGVGYYLLNQNHTTSVKEVTIAAIEPLTGDYAIFGKQVVQGVQLAAKHINDAGGIKSLGGAQIKVVVADSGGTAESAMLATEQVVSANHPSVIEGNYMDAPQGGINQIAEREHIVVLGSSLPDWLAQQGYSYWFRACPSDEINAKTTVDFVFETQQLKSPNTPIKKVAIIGPNDAFGEELAPSVEKYVLAHDSSIQIVYRQYYDPSITDVTPVVTNLISTKPDVIFFAGTYFYDGVLFAKALSEAHLKTMFIAASGASSFVDPDSISAAGSTVEYFTNTYSYNPAKNTPTNNKFVSDFKALYQMIPTEAAGIGYYNVRIAGEALELSGQLFPSDPLNGTNIRNAMLRLDLTSGPAAEVYPSGHVAFSPTGECIYEQGTVMQVINGASKVVYPYQYEETNATFPRPDWTPST